MGARQVFVFLLVSFFLDIFAVRNWLRYRARQVLADEVDAQEATLGQHYGLNRFGQNTTGVARVSQRSAPARNLRVFDSFNETSEDILKTASEIHLIPPVAVTQALGSM